MRRRRPHHHFILNFQDKCALILNEKENIFLIHHATLTCFNLLGFLNKGGIMATFGSLVAALGLCSEGSIILQLLHRITYKFCIRITFKMRKAIWFQT